jgi:hypothetical protein
MASDRTEKSAFAEVIGVLVAQNVIDVFLTAPSLPLALMFRRNLGFRVLRPWIILLALLIVNTVAFLAVAAAIAAPSKAVGGLILYAIGFGTLVAGIYWRSAAWKLIKRQQLWHSRSRGVSYLSKVLPWREDIVQRYVEPAIGLVVGLVLLPLYFLLGLWFIGASVCLYLCEQFIYDLQLNVMLDQYDGIIDAEVAAENSAVLSAQGQPPTIEKSSGVSVVVAPELQQLIEQRRALKASQLPA